jgi:hypothetical protein
VAIGPDIPALPFFAGASDAGGPFVCGESRAVLLYRTPTARASGSISEMPAMAE